MGPLYPNLYTVLVAPPGIGKTIVAAQCERLWRDLEDHFVAPTSLTKAALIDALDGAARRIVRPGQNPPYVEFNSLLVLAGELGVLLPQYDPEFLNALTAIYDGHSYEEKRRTKDLHIKIMQPQLNILGCTTPSYLKEFMPDGAWDQGFISRVILVFAGESVRQSIFNNLGPIDSNKDLLGDLKIIGNLYGEFTIEDEVKAAIDAWYIAGCPPVPEHPKLEHYRSRRHIHLLKLCMVAATARDDSLRITIDDYRLAMDYLIEAEFYMPDIFRAMGGGSNDARAMEELWYYVYTSYAKEKSPINEARCVHFLASRVPSFAVPKILDNMKNSEMILQKHDKLGRLGYVPGTSMANMR